MNTHAQVHTHRITRLDIEESNFVAEFQKQVDGVWVSGRDKVTGTLLSEASFENIKPIINIEKSNGVDEKDVEFGVLKTLGWKC